MIHPAQEEDEIQKQAEGCGTRVKDCSRRTIALRLAFADCVNLTACEALEVILHVAGFR